MRSASAHTHFDSGSWPHVPHVHPIFSRSSFSTALRGGERLPSRPLTECCAETDAVERQNAASSAIVVVAAVVAALASGTFSTANAYIRSGSKAIAVPRANTPKPTQIQSTSGLIVISRLAVWVARSDGCQFMT